jgi:hypothetical protein
MESGSSLAFLEVLLTSGFPRKQTPLACLFGSLHDKEKKRRKAWGEEFRFCSYMPPFFFDFFFLAFVGLFTRLHIHNSLCLRNLLFFRKSIFRDRIFFLGMDRFNARPRDRWQIFLSLDILVLSSIFSSF